MLSRQRQLNCANVYQSSLKRRKHFPITAPSNKINGKTQNAAHAAKRKYIQLSFFKNFATYSIPDA
jgi:hypothetical protein